MHQKYVLEYLDTFKCITPRYAKEFFGIDDLDKYVEELVKLGKQMGFRIEPCWHGENLVGYRYVSVRS